MLSICVYFDFWGDILITFYMSNKKVISYKVTSLY